MYKHKTNVLQSMQENTEQDWKCIQREESEGKQRMPWGERVNTQASCR